MNLMINIGIFVGSLFLSPSNEADFSLVNINFNKLDTLTQSNIESTLSYFPELQNIQIEFREQNIKTTMAARPKFNFMLKRKHKREYVIYFNNTKGSENVPLFEELTLTQQQGLIAHELSHIVDYSGKTNLQVIKLGLRYLSKNGRRAIEHRVDEIAFERGFASQIYEYSKYILQNEDISETYKSYKADIYYEPHEILEFIEKESDSE